MKRLGIIYLRIAASFLVMLSTLSTSMALTDEAETSFEDENNKTDFTATYNENELMDQEIGLNFRFLTSMLQMLDLNLNLINGTLNSRVEEYPFLQATIEGTGAGIATTNSILGVLGSNPENLSDMENSMVSLNENMERLNASLGYPDDMIEAANSTIGEPDSTTPMIVEMFKSVKAMTELFE
ncbi:hypothetical protein [Methanosarcina sp. UBA5]|uniref:hypothetical protein n=1 Tax=Methanosarcina sp. UBA5 TaxID=1915593 RepID=UPI0025DC8641|nr:hypothetical protein [Methanosarcina sp. UBA5]